MKPIEPTDLRPVEELSRSFFRATNPHITGSSFELKWGQALSSPLRFMRSFPRAFYVDHSRQAGAGSAQE
ncbi:MAG: hypothetical protein MJE77_04115 [Proteobacteria bacterium]|nr:hypothetical protein [Pseudomonadota bacterium]